MGSDVLYKSPCCDSEYYSALYQFSCYIKSHCEAPDYESFVEAKDMEDAIEVFFKRCRWYTRQELREKHVIQDSEEAVGYVCDICGKRFEKPNVEGVDYDLES